PAMDTTTRARYADAIVRGAVGVGPGDMVAVHGERVHRDLFVAITEAAYRAGAQWADVLPIDMRVKRMRGLHAPEDSLGFQPEWYQARMRELLDRDAAIIQIAGSEEPDLLGDVPPERAAKDRSSPLPGRELYLEAVSSGTARFVVASSPTPAWAAQVYPDLPEGEALAALARDLALFARIGPDDPPDAWVRHVAMLEAAA